MRGSPHLLALCVGVGAQIEQLLGVFLPQALFAKAAKGRHQAMQAVGVVAPTLANRCVQIPITQTGASQDVETIVHAQRSSGGFVYDALQRAIVQAAFLFGPATLAHGVMVFNPRGRELP